MRISAHRFLIVVAVLAIGPVYSDCAADLGLDMFYRGLGSFGNTAISRSQLLAQFEAIVSNYPHSEYADRAKPIANVLKRMVSEDAAHAMLAQTNLDQLPAEQQVGELIFRLRDQNGYQMSQPGSCDIFADIHGSTNTPAHKLLKLGRTAVPQLIAALDDQSFSRSVGVGPAWVPSVVLTVGDCAEAILERIAGQNFHESHSTTGYMSNEGNMASTKKAVESWWAEFQNKGEKQVLIDAISSASQDAPAKAEILCQRYPDIAAATIIRGARATTNSWVHARLVEIVSKLDEPQVTEFLRQEMSSATSPTDRERAAFGLRARGKDEEAMQGMLHDWKASGDGMAFLADSDSVPAIQALGRGLLQRPVNTRYLVIQRIGDTNAWSWGGRNNYSLPTLNAIEGCLVAALDDTEVRAGITQVNQSGTLRTLYDVRICDMAGFCLAQRWPERYVFDLSPGLSTRNRQRVECQNVWRRAHDLPALPVAQTTTNHVRPDQANLVTAIEWAEDTVKPSADFAAKVDAFRGKLLDTNKLVTFLAALGTNPEPKSSGIEFKAIKDDDLTGVRLMIRLLPGPPPVAGREDWNFDRRITLGGKTLERTGGGDFAGIYSHAGSSGWFPSSLAKVFAAEPETPFEIYFILINSKIAGNKPLQDVFPIRRVNP